MDDAADTVSPPAPTATKRSRWFLRYRLRTLLILVPLATFAVVYGYRWYLDFAECRAAGRIEAAGGVVTWDEERRHVRRVQLPSGPADDDLLRALFPALQSLPRLESLIVSSESMTDLGVEPLADLPSLKVLYLAGTKISPEAVARMRTRNPSLEIDLQKPHPKAFQLASRPIYKNAVISLGVTAAGKLAAGSGDGRVRLWNQRLTRSANVIEAHKEWAFAIARHPQANVLATGGGDGLIKFWDERTGDEVGRLTGHDDDVHAIAFTPDGRTLVSTGDDMTVRVWDIFRRRERFILTGHEATIPTVAVSPGGDLAASGGRDHTIRLWDLATGEQVAVLAGHQDDVMSVDFDPTGRELASVSYDGSLRIWNVAERRETASFRRHGDRVYSVRWSPDGTRLVTAAGDGVRMFVRADFRVAWREDPNTVSSAVVWLDDRRLATASADGVITIRSAAGELIARLSAL